MGDTSESASTHPWLWVIEALAGFKEIDKSTLQDLIDVSPGVPNDFGKNTRELVAMRCLEGLFDSASGINSDASSWDSRVGLDFSQSCEDVLQQILHEIPLSNLKIAGAKLLKWDIYPFIMHRRASTMKCELEQLKESVIEGTHPCTERLRERSGLALQNRDYQVPANDGKCNDLAEKDNENCTYAEIMGAKENASSKEHLLDKIFAPSKRNRDHPADEHVMRFLHEKQVDVDECDDVLRNAKKNKCYAPSNIESKKDKRVHPHGRDVSENSTERVPLIFEREGHHTENDHVATLGECLVLEHCDGCTTSSCCRRNSHNEVCHDLSDIPFNTTMRPQVESITTNVALPDEIQHEIFAGDASTNMMPECTLGDEPCQNTILRETKDDNEHHIEPVQTNIDDPDKIQHKSNKSQSEQEIGFQLKEPNAAYPNGSWKLVASDEAFVDAVNGCRAEHNDMIDFAAKKHEFLSSQYTSRHDFSASTDWIEQNLCMKCNENGQLLVCRTTTCQLKVHESCLGTPVRLDGKGYFFCPFCAYSHAVSEYLEAKKKASLARKDLCVFLGKALEHQATELSEVHRKENSLSKKRQCEHIHVKDNGNDQIPGIGREDEPEDHVIEHVNQVNNLQFERSQQQAEPPASCDNILPSCREKGIVNNRIDKVSVGEEMGGMMNPKRSTVRGLDENQVPVDQAAINDNFFGQEANFLSVNQNNTGDEIQHEMLEQHNTNRTEEPACAHDNEEDNISEDDCEKPINSRYSMRSRKRETRYKPQAIPLLRRRKIPWTAEEEEILREGVRKFGVSDQKIPWKQILEFGSDVFLKERTPVDLKDKWKNICKARSKLN